MEEADDEVLLPRLAGREAPHEACSTVPTAAAGSPWRNNAPAVPGHSPSTTALRSTVAAATSAAAPGAAVVPATRRPLLSLPFFIDTNEVMAGADARRLARTRRLATLAVCASGSGGRHGWALFVGGAGKRQAT
ncbi:hypothetical protein CDD83_4781 [Cordyceps sp. RAO-2017]|nr:hypothetical protein CDD83_4781 [Cordyceps sp. RAO-2017]